ncbi:unnamed protein product, partial [Mesorhabditis belari]|uniref:Uncharacterized protein n=1 Tax=Mesorhabditis belari TaxID=2138241 RepID=A0AAF3EJ13_9BILA
MSRLQPGASLISIISPPAYEDIDRRVLGPAPPYSSLHSFITSTGPPAEFLEHPHHHTSNPVPSSFSADRNLFPRANSEAEGGNDNQPPPYQFRELSVVELDETAHQSEIDRSVDELARRRIERDNWIAERRAARRNNRGIISNWQTLHDDTLSAKADRREACRIVISVCIGTVCLGLYYYVIGL